MVFVTFDVETFSTIDSTNNIRNFRIVDLIWFIHWRGRTNCEGDRFQLQVNMEFIWRRVICHRVQEVTVA